MGDNLELVKKMLSFSITNIIGHYTKYGQDFLDNEAFNYLPDIRKLGITDITEDEFYKLIGLTRQEIHKIKSLKVLGLKGAKMLLHLVAGTAISI